MSVKSAKTKYSWITELFESSSREISDRKVGIEIERIAMWPSLKSFSYSDGEKPGATTLLKKLSKQHIWPIITNNDGSPLGLTSTHGKVSLEPGSQVELSTDPLKDLFQVQKEVDLFEAKVSAITDEWGLMWLTLGTDPLHAVKDIELIPSVRYQIMTDYFEQRSRLGTSMMRRTASVQINLDYTSEKEAIEMLRASLLTSPVSYALFGNSPFIDGKMSGYCSYRNQIWLETDPKRTGMFSEAFSKDFNFERLAEYLWKEPLMFVQNRKKQYVPANGMNLHDIEEGKIDGVLLDDTNQWNAIRQLFTDSRVKPGYVEIRSLDNLCPKDRYASTAFWMGLLYSEDARKLCMELLGKYDDKKRRELNLAVAKDGMKAESFVNIVDISKKLFDAAHASLKTRGLGEEVFLEPLREIIETKMNPAQRIIANWKGDMSAMLNENKF